jgi:hypothetical protein
MRAQPVRLVTTAAGVGVLALALAASAPSSAADPSSDRRLPRSETLHLVLRNPAGTDPDADPEVPVDVGDPGFGPGDYAVTTQDVLSGEQPLGRLTQQCTVMRLDPELEEDPDALLQCTITLLLTDGQVTVQGSFGPRNFPPTLAVTGGTGRYLGVWGELEETETEAEAPADEAGADGGEDGHGGETTADLRLHHPRR